MTPIKTNHIVISGTGRAGTSFLVSLFTRLGLETGFTEKDLTFDPTSRAGLEYDLRTEQYPPYIVKDPALCNYIPQVLARLDIGIELVIIPMRDIYQAAQSRREVWKVNMANKKENKPIHGGGLMNEGDPAVQEVTLAFALYRLLLDLSVSNIPVLLLSYERMMSDRKYLFNKLSGNVCRDRNLLSFNQAYSETIKPEWIHDYKDVDRSTLSDIQLK